MTQGLVRLRFARAASVMLIALLAACGGDGDLEPPEPDPVPSRISGVLTGTVTRASQAFNVFVFANAGRFMAADVGGTFYDGTYTVNGGSVTGSLRLYQGNPANRTFIRQVSDDQATFTATVTTAGWQGTIQSTIGSLAFDLDYDAELDTQDSALTFLEGDWLFESGTYDSALAIAEDGSTATTNTDNGVSTQCNSAGNAGIIEANFGTYAWETTVSGSGCGLLAGDYTGFGVLVDGTAPLDTLPVFLANANYFLAYRSYLRQP